MPANRRGNRNSGGNTSRSNLTPANWLGPNWPADCGISNPPPDFSLQAILQDPTIPGLETEAALELELHEPKPEPERPQPRPQARNSNMPGPFKEEHILLSGQDPDAEHALILSQMIAPGSTVTLAQLGLPEAYTPAKLRVKSRMFPAEKAGEWEPTKVREKKIPARNNGKNGNNGTSGGVDDDDDDDDDDEAEDVVYEEDPNSEEGAVYPIRKGKIVNWSCFYALLTHVHNTLSPPLHTPIFLVSEPRWTVRDRDLVTQFIFEKFKTPAFAMMDSPLAVIYGYGLATATVIDVGHEKVNVAAFVEHVPVGIGRSAGLMGNAGACMTKKLHSLLAGQGFTFDMAEQLKRSTICEILPLGQALPTATAESKATSGNTTGGSGAGHGSSNNNSAAATAFAGGAGSNTGSGAGKKQAGGEDATEESEGVLDVASIVASGKTSEFLAKKDREKAEKTASKRKGGGDASGAGNAGGASSLSGAGGSAAAAAAAANIAKLPNSQRVKNIFHYDDRRTDEELAAYEAKRAEVARTVELYQARKLEEARKAAAAAEEAKKAEETKRAEAAAAAAVAATTVAGGDAAASSSATATTSNPAEATTVAPSTAKAPETDEGEKMEGVTSTADGGAEAKTNGSQAATTSPTTASKPKEAGTAQDPPPTATATAPSIPATAAAPISAAPEITVAPPTVSATTATPATTATGAGSSSDPTIAGLSKRQERRLMRTGGSSPDATTIRREAEVGLERFQAVDGRQMHAIADAVMRVIMSVQEVSKRSELWESIVVCGNGGKIRGFREALLAFMTTKYVISPSSATIFTSELPSNFSTPAPTGANTPLPQAAGANNPPHHVQPGGVNPLLLAATTASNPSLAPPGANANNPGGAATAGGGASTPHRLTAQQQQLQRDQHHHSSHGQTPSAIRHAKPPEYFAEWKEAGLDEAVFLGAQVGAKIVFVLDPVNSTNGDKAYVTRAEYNEVGPTIIRDFFLG